MSRPATVRRNRTTLRSRGSSVRATRPRASSLEIRPVTTAGVTPNSDAMTPGLGCLEAAMIWSASSCRQVGPLASSQESTSDSAHRRSRPVTAKSSVATDSRSDERSDSERTLALPRGSHWSTAEQRHRSAPAHHTGRTRQSLRTPLGRSHQPASRSPSARFRLREDR